MTTYNTYAVCSSMTLQCFQDKLARDPNRIAVLDTRYNTDVVLSKAVLDYDRVHVTNNAWIADVYRCPNTFKLVCA